MANTVDLAGLPEFLEVTDDVRSACPLLVVDLNNADWSLADAAGAHLEHWPGIAVGISDRPLPASSRSLLEHLTVTVAPGGPGVMWVDAGPRTLEEIEATTAAAPLAAVVLDQVLRLTGRIGVEEGVLVESLAYSTLLAGDEFARWRRNTPWHEVPVPRSPVRLERDGGRLSIVLNQPERRNAFGRAMRDGLLEALAVAELDETIDSVELSGSGPCFCSGGDLDEFGTSRDVASAHLIRVEAHVGRVLHRLGERVTAHLHGACIGAGIEVPAFAGRVLAREGTWFQLPELSMGLIPGAGGTVSICRRVGRWRTAYLVLSGRRLELDSALEWGLVDARE